VVAFSFLASDVPFAILPAILFFAVSAPFATSYGVWLSLRCPTVNRALMWYLPVAGFLVLVPIGTANWISKPYWLLAFGIVFVLSAILSLGAWVFWRKAAAAFEEETVLGPRG
jgi:hypothetical protein